MSKTPQTIDEILAKVFNRGFAFALHEKQNDGISMNPSDAKQAIKEAILTEVIGENGVNYVNFDDWNFTNKKQDKLRAEQRQRLDAWLGLEDTSNDE